MSKINHTLREKLLAIKEVLPEAASAPWENGCDEDDPAIYTEDGACVGFVQPHGNIHTAINTQQSFSHADAKLITMMRNCIDEVVDLLLVSGGCDEECQL